MESAIAHWVALGERIREARQERGLSQADVAHRAKVARSWLSRIEAGHRGAELEPLLRLLVALDLSLVVRDGAASASVAAHPTAARLTEAARKRRAAWGLETEESTSGD